MSKIKNKKEKQFIALTDLTRNFNAAELNLIWFQNDLKIYKNKRKNKTKSEQTIN